MERVLPGKRKYLRIGGDDAQELDIWLIDSGLPGDLPWRQDGDAR